MALFKRDSTPANPHTIIQDCLRKRDYKGALGAFEVLLKGSTGPNSIQLRMRYADTLVLAGRKADAIKHYSLVAEGFAESGFLVRAVAIYKKVVKLDPRQADAVEKLAHLDAERNKHYAAAVATPSSAASSDDMGMEEFSDDDGGMEFDIGAGMGMGGGSAASAPVASPRIKEPPAPEIDPDSLGIPDDIGVSLDDLGVTEDDLGALGNDDLDAPVELAADVDLAPDLDLAPDTDLAPEVDLAPEMDTKEPQATPSFGDFEILSPKPATSSVTKASTPTTGVGLGFDFGFGGNAASVESATAIEPASSGLDFGEPAEVATSAASAPRMRPSDSPEEMEDLLGLLGDDIDSMLDDILSDVVSNEQGKAPEMAPANTNIGLFSHLAIDELVDVLKALDRTTARKGEVIVRVGEPGTSMFILTQGSVAATIEKDGVTIQIATLNEGNFFGEMSVLSGTPRSATVTALDSVELLVLERTQLEQIFSRHPEVEAKLRLAYAERAEQTASIQSMSDDNPLG